VRKAIDRLNRRLRNAWLRHQARAATEQTALTQAVIDHMVIGLVITGPDGTIESVNPAAERLFGTVSEDLIGRHLGVVLPAFVDQTPDKALDENRILAIGGVVESEAWRSGQTFPVEIALYGFPTATGRRFAVSLRDVSERHALDRLKRDFVSMVSHELRTPLTSIHGSLRLLRAGSLGPVTPATATAVQIAERNTARLLALINDILDAERLAAGEALRTTPVSIGDIVTHAVGAIQGVAEEHGITVEQTDVEGTVLGDADRLEQVIVNLLANAIKFSPEGGLVTIASKERFGWVEVTVTDRGRGIPANQRELVFEPFHQVDRSDARLRGGTGLGLAICRRIIDRHRGAIGVESLEGKGSTFWFRVPAAHATGQEARSLPLAAGLGR
jgi:PAS domain S-box-containing protein